MFNTFTIKTALVHHLCNTNTPIRHHQPYTTLLHQFSIIFPTLVHQYHNNYNSIIHQICHFVFYHFAIHSRPSVEHLIRSFLICKPFFPNKNFILLINKTKNHWTFVNNLSIKSAHEVFDHNWLNQKYWSFFHLIWNKNKIFITYLCLVFAYVCVCFTFMHLDAIFTWSHNKNIKYQVDFHQKDDYAYALVSLLGPHKKKIRTNCHWWVSEHYFFSMNS